MIFKNTIKTILVFITFISFYSFSFAQNSNQISEGSIEKVEISISPRTGSFIEGSNFEVPIIINTNSQSIKKIDIKVNYDKDRLSIVDPSGIKSIIGSWDHLPSYDNYKGILSYEGSIPEGIVTESGLLGTIKFKAISSGSAIININQSSSVILNDNLNTKASIDYGRAEYSIIKKVSDGPTIFSETHPSESKWYNNNSPIVSWQKNIGINGYSFELDNKPFTVPDNIVDSEDTTTSFNNLSDGLWYFHIKENKNGAWGTTGHFLIKIDTIPPAEFTPEENSFSASTILSGRSLVSFFTTDNLSGVDHYEIGTIDKSQPITEAPVFVEATSPYQVPVLKDSTLKVIVRAIDKAGNLQQGYIDITSSINFERIIKNNWLALVFLFIITLMVSYFIKNKINPLKHPDLFNTLESDIKNYVDKRNEINERSLIEKEKIENLERDLDKLKGNIESEIKNI